ncbi:Disease resistance protein [Quillaja saponaria]|uniref:Disease resistance protein n=1 Tax=Quillaja saponaria TaxID=32244 RepID=A0AAD7PNJ7_QUISA|nr:Disease resistance protein [Quillaja saponaria]
MAGDTAKALNVQPIAIEVVKRCAGLPVLIATVAKALKDAALYVWKDSLKQLERFDKDGMHAEVYSALELSYNHLKGQEIKSLFLLIALHGQRSVSKHDLLIISMGLGLFKYVDTLEDARNRLNKLTNDLEESCLLIKDEREIENVKIHDLVRYAGSSIAAKDQLFRTDIEFESKEWPRKDILVKYRGLLLSVHHQSDLPERLESPQLKLFALKCQEDHLKISDSFFEVMREVKVLCFYEMKLISSPPLVLHGLNCLRALYLYECTLEDISIVGELTNLEILSVRQSDLKQLPSEIGRLHRLKMLDLMYCKSLKVITPTVISNLIGLEELNMEGSFINWEVEAGCNSKSYNASLGELKELPSLRSLCIRIPDARTLSTDIFLFFGKLQKFKIEIGERTSWPSIYKFSQILTIKSSGSCIIQSENWIRILPEKVEYLKLDRVNGVKNVFLDMNAKGFSQLKVLKVSNDAETECLINFISSKNPRHVLQSLEKLVLKHWNNLVHICRGPITEESFCKLRIVRVYGCQKLKSLFSFPMSRIISQLVEIQVSNCVSMEEIVSLGREMENHDPGLGDIEFAELRYLKIMGLPALISFCSMRRISSVSQGLSHKLPIDTEIEKMDATGKYENSRK